MDTITINFKASGQNLTADANPQRYASNTVNYIQAVFDLDENWQSFDSVRAVWHNEFACISTVLDGNGSCTVPHEVLTNLDEVIVNLVGSDVDGDELVDRMTTYPHRVAIIDANARICGTETAEVTPSQFEQYIDIVEQIVGSVKDIDHTELTDDYCLIIYYSDGTNSGKLGPIRGATGATGNGIVSAVLNSDYTLTLTYDNGDSDTVGPIRGEQGETGNGIQSVYLTETHGAVKTYTILFTDGTTTTFDVTDGEVTLAQLESVLPTDTASGAIASFPDGTDLFPMKSCLVDINPIQDLHGYDSPWVGGGGKNILDPSAKTTYSGSEGARWYESNGFTLKANTTYVFKYFPTNAESVAVYIRAKSDGTTLAQSSGSVTYTPTADTLVYFQAYRSPSLDSSDNKFGLYIGSAENTWTPYSNICPISGWTGCEVTVDCVNIWDGVWESGEIYASNGQNANSSAQWRSKNYIPIKPSTSYYVSSASGLTKAIRARFYDFNKNYIGYSPQSGSTTCGSSFVTPSNAYYMRFSPNNSDIPNHDVGINYPSTYTDYTAYNGTTYPITWQTEAGTVYGGTVDVVTGVLTVTHALNTIDGTQNLIDNGTLPYGGKQVGFTPSPAKANGSPNSYSDLVSDKFHYISSAAEGSINGRTGNGNVYINTPSTATTMEQAYTWFENNPTQVWYKLATPTTIQLTPTEVSILLGQNNIFADCGDVAVTYKADVQRWVEKMLNA